jgi:hypothetical protein
MREGPQSFRHQHPGNINTCFMTVPFRTFYWNAASTERHVVTISLRMGPFSKAASISHLTRVVFESARVYRTLGLGRLSTFGIVVIETSVADDFT